LFNNLQFDFEIMLSKVINTEAEFFDVDVEYQQLPHEWGGDELNWYDRLEKDVLAWGVAVQSNIKRSILRRNTLSELLDDIEKQFGSMESVLRGLAITETTANGSIARRTIFELLGISKYKFYTRADERTCEICGSMHGLIFPMTAYEVGVTASPMHPRCRCFEVPIKG
jgi:SPP1 gp7 family putative phage head morphogenesis protein